MLLLNCMDLGVKSEEKKDSQPGRVARDVTQRTSMVDGRHGEPAGF